MNHDLEFDIRCAIRIAARHARFNRRLHILFGFVAIFSGGAAFAGFVSQSHAIAGISGLIVSAATALDFVLKPGSRMEHFERMQRAFGEVLMSTDSDDAIRLSLAKLWSDAAPMIEPLRWAAYNDVLIELGYKQSPHPLSQWQRFLAVIG